jgi:hypothetical protein
LSYPQKLFNKKEKHFFFSTMETEGIVVSFYIDLNCIKYIPASTLSSRRDRNYRIICSPQLATENFSFFLLSSNHFQSLAHGRHHNSFSSHSQCRCSFPRCHISSLFFFFCSVFGGSSVLIAQSSMMIYGMKIEKKKFQIE